LHENSALWVIFSGQTQITPAGSKEFSFYFPFSSFKEHATSPKSIKQRVDYDPGGDHMSLERSERDEESFLAAGRRNQR